jgi:hypothetical protein
MVGKVASCRTQERTVSGQEPLRRRNAKELRAKVKVNESSDDFRLSERLMQAVRKQMSWKRSHGSTQAKDVFEWGKWSKVTEQDETRDGRQKKQKVKVIVRLKEESATTAIGRKRPEKRSNKSRSVGFGLDEREREREREREKRKVIGCDGQKAETKRAQVASIFEWKSTIKRDDQHVHCLCVTSDSGCEGKRVGQFVEEEEEEEVDRECCCWIIPNGRLKEEFVRQSSIKFVESSRTG